MTPISVRARFERFPATVKGAFIIRGEDPDPHQVVVREARVVGVGGGRPRPVPIASTTLDVAPRQDLFVPFELSVSDLDPGWYGFECDLDVDGAPGTYPGGRRFSVPWPRATVRRGTIRVGQEVRLGEDARARVDQLDCAGDCVKIGLAVTPGHPLSPRLLADGTRLEILDVEIDPESGRGRIVAYPLLRSHGVLRIELRTRGRGAEGALDIELP
ncbi:MAG TPA: hypothetical protein VFC04_08920 [Actinomycetota bacterium]|nr:hypothetical protein [Actinomycetota bacterium]